MIPKRAYWLGLPGLAFIITALGLLSCGSPGRSGNEPEPLHHPAQPPTDAHSDPAHSTSESSEPSDIDTIVLRSELDEEILSNSAKCVRIWGANDDQLKRICERAPQLRVLDIRGSSVLLECLVTDEGIASAKSLKQLRELTIVHARYLTSSGMEVLKCFPSLSILRLWRCSQLTGDVLRYLPSPNKLEVLEVSGWQSIDDKDLQYLQNATLLTELYMTASFRGTSAVLISVLRALSRLRVLSLGYCKAVNDDVAFAVANLPCIEEVYLGSTSITDKSLMSLAGAATLKYLNVQTCPKTTADGVKNFVKARPDVTLVQ